MEVALETLVPSLTDYLDQLRKGADIVPFPQRSTG